jgi:ribosome-binding protein aMBF1 (putative translation factor)
MVAEASINAKVAQLLYEARTKAGLTQQQLAELIGTKQPVIARLEDADYEALAFNASKNCSRPESALRNQSHLNRAPIEPS